MYKHRIILKNFQEEDGTISFSALGELQKKIVILAESATRSLVEGRSKPGRGQRPKWLKEISNFRLSGLIAGSTVLEIEAPEIGTILSSRQIALFDEPEIERLFNESAFGLINYAYSKAIDNEDNSSFLDKHILQQIISLEQILDNDEAEIILDSGTFSQMKPASVTKRTLEKISVIEQQMPDSVKTSLVGTLDVMRHTRQQMEIVTSDDKRFRAYPGPNQNIKDLKSYFGEKVRLTGLAHFKPDRQVKAFEILDIKGAAADDTFHEELSLPIFEDIDLKRIAREQEWQGFDEKKFRSAIKELDVKESPEELIELLNS